MCFYRGLGLYIDGIHKMRPLASELYPLKCLEKSVIGACHIWKWSPGEVDEKIGKFASRSPSPLLIRAPRNLAISLSTPFPVSTEDKPTQKIFALETFTALGKIPSVLPLSNSMAGRNSFCSYTPACPGSSIYPTLCECLSRKSDIISINLNDGLCPTSNTKCATSKVL